MEIKAIRRGEDWNKAVQFRARSLQSGMRTAARKLGLKGPIINRQRIGDDYWLVNVDGEPMLVSTTDPAPNRLMNKFLTQRRWPSSWR